jgi:hypothetical protein
MLAVPTATEVTTPDAEFTVAIAAFEEVQVPPFDVLSKSAVVCKQMLVTPVMAAGLALIVADVVVMQELIA